MVFFPGYFLQQDVKIFFSGIGGSGVSAIAGFMAERGHIVYGSDRLFDRDPDNRICRLLKSKGIAIVPQDGGGLDSSFDAAVFSTAVEKDNPDFVRAERLGITIRTRPEYLAEIVSRFRTVAVAGTSGKSTVSGMLAFLMCRLGMKPNFIGGGRVKGFRTPGNPGNWIAGDSDLLVIEACESDGTIVHYRPAYTIISNLDLDHHTVQETALMFRRLAENTSGLVITGADDKNMAACGITSPVSFSIENNSAYRARDIEYGALNTSFSVLGRRFELSLPGRHNLYNALACIALLLELGADAGDIAEHLPAFSGIERRFDVHLNDGRHLVVDDYAHNPHKISCLMETMRGISDRVCYIFQPHGYGPTRLMKERYIETFATNLRHSDVLVLLPIYYAGGTAAKDISSGDIAGPVAASGKAAMAIGDRKDIFRLADKWDSYVIFGARDDSLSDYAEYIAKQLSRESGVRT
jgi:UDP-N-acetylmuramate--alanine ligase